MTQTRPLPWFPLDADEWINRIQVLSLEATGALLVAVLAAWNAQLRGDAPGTLPASDAAMARLLGPSWRRVLPVVREHFVEDPDDPTRVRCAWLVALHTAQLAKHQSAADRGRRGGWPKGKPRGKRNSSAIAQLSPSLTEVEGDPVGGSSGAPTTGGGDAAAGRGGATAAPPPDETVPDPPPVCTDAVLAWADARPAERRAIEREVDAHCDDENPGWRERTAGAGLRNRLVTMKLTEAYVRERARIPSAGASTAGMSAGAAYA